MRTGLLASACVTSAFVTSASAQTAWTDGTGDWFNAGNWSAGVPTAATPQTTVGNGGTAQIAGAAANAGTLLVINGGSTVDLQAGGSLTASGITVGTNGTLLLSGSTAVTGPLTLDGGTLRSTLSGTLTNAVTIDAGFSATFAATGGQTLTLASSGFTSFLGGAGTTVHFGSATDTGTVVLGPTDTASNPAGAGAVDGGTLKIGNLRGSDLIFTFQGGLTVGSGTTAATLDLNGFSTFAWNLTGTSAGTITNSGAATTLTTRTAATSTFAGVIQDGASGSGGMSVHVSSAVGGPGTLILTGANTYTGGTTIDAFQTLQIGNGGASGSIVGNVVNNGTLAIDRSGTLLLAGNISGAGAFQQIGPGTTILSGTNTYTGNTAVLGGTLQLGNGGASGSIIGDVVNNGTLAINRSDTYTFGGVISGAGAFAQIGTGTTILTAANTYTGGTTISSGTLQLGNGGSTGALVGSVTNNATFDIVNADTSGITAITNNGLLRFFNANTAGNAAITNNFSTQFSDASNAGNATITNNRGLSFLGTSSAGTATIVTNNGGITAFFAGSIGGLARLITNAGAAVDISGLTTAGMTAGSIEGAGNYFLGSKQLTVGGNNLSTEVSGTIQDGGAGGGGTGGSLVKVGAGTLTLSGANTYSGGTTLAGGTLRLANNQALGTGALTTTGSVVDYANGVNIANAIVINSNTTQLSVTTGSATQAGAISELNGPRPLEKIGGGTLVLTAANTYSGTTTISAGTLQLGNGGTSGSILGNVVDNGILAVNRSDTFTLSNAISGSGAFQQNGSGATVLTAANTYSGPTTVSAGALVVNGSIANSAVTVGNGAMLAGTGTVGATTINAGGIFAPGASGTPGTMTIRGNLAFQSGALYVVQVNPSSASLANVTASGSATLAGTVGAQFSAGSYVTRSYTIVSAAGGRNGTFNALSTANLPAGFTASLSYTPTDAILNLTATLAQPSGPTGPSGPNALGAAGFNVNQLNVAKSLNGFFNNGGALPPAFVSVFGLTGGNLANALTLLSGEVATGSQQVGFQLTDQFLSLVLDPFVDGRSGIAGAGGPALGFAPEREELPEAPRSSSGAGIALAYSKVLKAAPAIYEPRWTAWGAGFGGSNRTSGDVAVIGSHDLSANVAGFAGGFDYRVTPNTVVGIAFAGAGTNWGLAQGLGSGKSDAFQAGLYGATRWGAAYLAAAFAYGNHWMSTDRIGFANDHLTADFNAQSLGGRVEGGYRFATFYGGVTPYAAIRAQSFRTPSYSEIDTTNGGFGLSYNGRTGTDTRSELGARFDRALALYSNAVLSFRGRLAWAHDWVSDPTLAAAFQTLPGASFLVNGATPAKDSVLTTAGAEYRLANGITLLGKFDGEFASHSSTYAGTGTLRYSW